MNRQQGLETWLRELEEEIEVKEEQIRPQQEGLYNLREQYAHVSKLLDSIGASPTRISQNVRLNWAEIAREHGLKVGGDSAHRVVLRMNSSLHASTPHLCTINGNSYP